MKNVGVVGYDRKTFTDGRMDELRHTIIIRFFQTGSLNFNSFHLTV